MGTAAGSTRAAVGHVVGSTMETMSAAFNWREGVVESPGVLAALHGKQPLQDASLLSNFVTYDGRIPTEPLNIMILGFENSGKSALMNHLFSTVSGVQREVSQQSPAGVRGGTGVTAVMRSTELYPAFVPGSEVVQGLKVNVIDTPGFKLELTERDRRYHHLAQQEAVDELKTRRTMQSTIRDWLLNPEHPGHVVLAGDPNQPVPIHHLIVAIPQHHFTKSRARGLIAVVNDVINELEERHRRRLSFDAVVTRMDEWKQFTGHRPRSLEKQFFPEGESHTWTEVRTSIRKDLYVDDTRVLFIGWLRSPDLAYSAAAVVTETDARVKLAYQLLLKAVAQAATNWGMNAELPKLAPAPRNSDAPAEDSLAPTT